MSMLKKMRFGSFLLAIVVTASIAQPATPRETLTRKELKALIASAKTPADHERIAAYYRSESLRLATKSREHEEDLAEYYRAPWRYPGKYPTMGDHCRSLAGHYKLAAERAAARAVIHERLAQEVR
mgnify:CR=1 FL=1